MFLMLAEVLRLGSVARAFPESSFWNLLARNQSHAEWVGCTLHDLIQPSFSFIVGVSLAFSLAARRAAGRGPVSIFGHALWRALVLVFLGIFLRSVGKPSTHFTFEDTLTQIGLGYVFLTLAGFGSQRARWMAFLAILIGTWWAFASYSAPALPEGPPPGVASEWFAQHRLGGFAAHWNKNANLGWAFDRWFLNLFPRENPFEFNAGGYATLSFIPTLATMILGLIAGDVLRGGGEAGAKLKWLAYFGAGLWLAGWLLHAAGICPLVKRIWTPAWVLGSGGACLLLMAAFYYVADVLCWRWWTLPLLVVGSNSIAAYCMDHLFVGFIRASLKTHLGPAFFTAAGPAYEALVQGACVFTVIWTLLYLLYRKRWFIRI
jgi:predicted acyltransferase